MKKQLITAGIVATVGTATIAGVGIAGAESTTSSSSSTNPMSSLVNAIATKFNLNKADVQKVFDEQRSTMQADREAQIKKEVAQLVTDGKLTQAQADLINAKRVELQNAREANRSTNSTKSRDEMKSEREAERTALKAWAKNNGIADEYLRYVMGGHDGPPSGSPDSSSNSTS